MGTYADKLTQRVKGKTPRKLSKEQAEALVKEVRDNISSAWEHERTNIEEAQLDQRFRANDQWPDAARRQREADGRPVLTFNRLNTFVSQVVNPIRQADKAIKAKVDDNTSDPTLAKVCDGLFRKIQRQSQSGVVFGHMLDCQAGCGIGWVRICNDYKSNQSFEQDIYLEKIDNPLSVFVDPASRDPVRSDAMWMAVTEMWPEATFKARWPDADPVSVDDPAGITSSGFYWRDGQDVRVAEYYKRVPTKKLLVKLANGETQDITGLPEAQAMQLPVQDVREVDGYRVEKYIVSGNEVLEGPTELPGCYIPLVPAVGGEIALERGVYRFGVIRFARDPQRMYNLNRSAMAEWIAQSPKAPWLVTHEMIAKHRSVWDSQGLHNRNYLPYTADKNAPTGGPTRVDPPAMPVAMAQEAQFAAEDMKSGTGIHDASLGAKSNETSGIAIARRQMEGDVANYHFADNFEASLTQIGTILMEWMPSVYDTPRTVILLGEDGEEHPTPINTPQMDPQTGEMVVVNDLSRAKFGVQVVIGPSYSTRRIESSQQIGEFMKAIPPEQAALITDIYARNQDWEGHEEIAKRLKATIPPPILAQAEAPIGPDGQPIPPPPPPPDPMQVAALQEMQAKIEKIAADIGKVQADTAKAMADREKVMADAALTVVQAKQLDRQDALMDFPGNQPAQQQTGRMDEPGARPNYLQ